MEKQTIVVLGATGAQGKGVVDALVEEGQFKVRAVTRKPDQYAGKAQEAVYGDLNEAASLETAFANAYGVFAVTNFWEGADEVKQVGNAIEAAKTAGIQHFIWSTLPDVEVISEGKFDVPHFSGKAKADDLVKQAGFTYTTFVQPPFYYQNLTGMLGPQPQQDGTTGWTLPLNPSKKAIHMSDINDLGKVVAAAFLQPEKAGHGEYLSLATEFFSFNDIIAAYKANGQELSFTQVPREVFAGFFEGAKEYGEMFGYFENYSYMGPDSEARIARAKEVTGKQLIPFQEWLAGQLSVANAK